MQHHFCCSCGLFSWKLFLSARHMRSAPLCTLLCCTLLSHAQQQGQSCAPVQIPTSVGESASSGCDRWGSDSPGSCVLMECPPKPSRLAKLKPEPPAEWCAQVSVPHAIQTDCPAGSCKVPRHTGNAAPDDCCCCDSVLVSLGGTAVLTTGSGGFWGPAVDMADGLLFTTAGRLFQRPCCGPCKRRNAWSSPADRADHKSNPGQRKQAWHGGHYTAATGEDIALYGAMCP